MAEDIDAFGYFDLTPQEQSSETSAITAAMAGIVSGVIKVPEGVVSLGAELIDLGFDTDLAAKVETAFDRFNIFEEVADDRAIGKLAETIIQIGVPGGIGFKLASKAVKAKKAGNYMDATSGNLQKAAKKANDYNKTLGRKKFLAGMAGGVGGEAFVANVEDIGSFGDVFEAGPTQLEETTDEGGRVGSKALVESDPQWLDDVNYVISFDRYGKKSIITHQMGRRTASDKFAKLLAKTLELPLKPDPNGSYTDSNVYRSKVSECTNVSVGYYSQHSTEEKQDVVYAYKLLECLLSADWDQLQYYRDNTVVEMGSMYGDWYDDDYFWGHPPRNYGRFNDKCDIGDNRIYDMIVDYPEEVALLLEELGYTADELHEMLGIQDHGYINEYLERVS